MPKSAHDQNAEMKDRREKLRDDVRALCNPHTLATAIAALQEVQFDMQFEERMFRESIKDLPEAEQKRRELTRIVQKVTSR